MWHFIILSLCLSSCLAGALDYLNIVRPCRLEDYGCIGANLAANSECYPYVSNYFPNTLHVPKFKFYAPYFNSTYIEFNLKVKNIDKCYVAEFFIDQATKVIVLALECPLLGFDAYRSLDHHRSLREDSTFHYYYNGTYPLVRLTANLKRSNHMSLCLTNVLADVTALPTFQVEPKDKKTADFLSQDPKSLTVFEVESFFYRGRYIMRDFVSAFMCNYNCPYVYHEGSF